MSNNKLIPKIRFKEFNNSKLWIKRELIDYADVRDGTHDSPKYQEKGHPFITSKNVANGYINYQDVQYISTEDFNNINKRSKVDKNDILMGMIGTIGNIALVREEPDYAIKNVALIKESNRIYYLYLYHLLQSNIFKKQLKDAMDGGTQKFIALNRIRTLNIKAPQKKEQYKIGSFFEKLDKMIQLQQSKVNKVKDIKSAYLSEMFPKEGEKYPKKRFEGFKEPWKEYSLGEVGNLYQTQTISRTSLQSSGIPVFGANGYIGYYSNANHEKDQITISARGENAGNPSYVVGPVWITGNSMVVNVDENTNINKKYLYSYLSSQRLEKYITGGAQPQLTRDVLNKVPIQVPSFLEQEKIGQFFKNLDNQISIEEEKLAKLEKLKQAYLNDMFV